MCIDLTIPMWGRLLSCGARTRHVTVYTLHPAWPQVLHREEQGVLHPVLIDHDMAAVPEDVKVMSFQE